MPSHLPPVAITGIGAVSGHGWGSRALWEGLRAGRPAIRPLRRFDPARHRTGLAAEVPAVPGGTAPREPRLSWSDRLALAAAREAVGRADLHPRRFHRADVGVFLGSSTGGMFEAEEFFRILRGPRSRLARASRLASQPNHGPGDAVARALGVKGPVETISSACASAAMAIAGALDALRAGEVEVAIVGGSDSLCQLTYAGFNALRAVSPEPARPFRAGRTGLSLGEGAAVLILEAAQAARARGARPLGWLLGAGCACDAYHMTAPEPEGVGAAAAMRAALRDAGVGAEGIHFVNAHGTGTPLNDASEWQALRQVFGADAGRVPVTATKGIVGHLLGACGALEAVATVLCLLAREVHPTPGDGEPDPAIPVDLVQGEPRPLVAAVPRALSTSLGFGGANAALVLAGPEEGEAR